MMMRIFDGLTKNKVELIFINIIIQLFLFRTAVPELKYPFILLFILFVVYIVGSKKYNFFSLLKDIVADYKLILLLLLILIVTFFLSHKIYLIVFKEISSVFILISLFSVLMVFIDSKSKLQIFVKYFVTIIIFSALLVSIFGILNILCIYTNSIDDFGNIDNNFALLPVLFGMISILYMLISKALLTYQKVFFNLSFSILSLNILLAGSRRGFIVLTCIILFLVILQIFIWFKRQNQYQKIILKVRNATLLLMVMIFVLYLFTFQTPCALQNRSLELIGSKDIRSAKENISLSLFSFTTIFDETKSFSKFRNDIWYNEFNSKDPDCGWGLGNNRRVSPLIGENSEIVPRNAVGCLIDSNSFYSTNAQRTIVLINNFKVEKDQKYRATIYCYVSNEFDGYSASIRLGQKVNNKIVLVKEPVCHNDLNCKGVWQKLEIEFVVKNIEAPILFTVIKSREKSKRNKNLKGYVILAYPEINKIDSENNITKFTSNYIVSEAFRGLFANIYMQEKPLISEIKNENIKTNHKSNISKTNIFPFSFQMDQSLVKIDKDPIRNLASTFISEDTTYYEYKNKLHIDTLINRFSGARINRWRFAMQIFLKEYNLKQKVFGGGFSFLNWYGYYFYHDKTKSDYPHNPFLYILLYSGLIGFFLYSFFIYKVFYLYIKYVKEYYLIFIFFLLTFFFTFFSGGNPFDPPIMGFFVIFPFLIHSIHKKEKSELENE